MTEISITEFRSNLKYYCQKVIEDDLMIMNNGKPVMQISNPNKHRIELVRSIMGCVPYHGEDIEKIMEEKLKEI